MCDDRYTERVTVTIAAHLSSTGHEKRRPMFIDACIAPIVRALERAGIHMLASCCGHGRTLGRIDLTDGRVLFIGADERVNGVCTNVPTIWRPERAVAEHPTEAAADQDAAVRAVSAVQAVDAASVTALRAPQASGVEGCAP